VDLIVEAFAELGQELIVIGDGPENAKLEQMATPNVKLLGYQPNEVVNRCLQQAKAFVLAADEDFGIAPVEAQAAGCPVIAYGKGGALETVNRWPAPEATGVFFEEQTPEALRAAVKLFEAHEHEYESAACRRNAERFGQQRFQKEFRAAIEQLWSSFQRGEDRTVHTRVEELDNRT
jgi:glycosyltransferase involved in cell wall biosynthesis